MAGQGTLTFVGSGSTPATLPASAIVSATAASPRCWGARLATGGLLELMAQPIVYWLSVCVLVFQKGR